MSLNADRLRQEILRNLRTDLKSEIDTYQQSLNLNYQRTNLLLNYIPVIISLITVAFIIYYLISGAH